MTMRCVITGVGGYLPERVLTNKDLESMVETTDIWIRERTGITKRHIAAEGECTSHMAIAAAKKAIAAAKLKPEDIGAVVVATSTPDATMPSVASMVQAGLKLPHGPALDVEAACTGFVYALSVAQGWLLSEHAKHVLVIGAETMSRIIDWKDRSTCILFGDGAGAVVLSAQDEKSAGDRGILSLLLRADGTHGSLLGTNGGTSGTQTAGTLFMEGQEVFRHGVENMSSITVEAAQKAGLTLSDIDWVVAHQANARMIRSIARKLGADESKMVVTVDKHANTSAASIPLALSEMASKNEPSIGKIVAMPALGAGLTWGCCIIRW